MPRRDPVKGPTKALKGRDRSRALIAEALQRASAAMENRRPDEAERIAREVLATDAQQPRALHVLGIALLAQGRPQEAVTALEQAARLLCDPMIDMHLGIAQRQVGRVADAIASLRRATEQGGALPIAFHELGVLLFTQRRLEEAETVVRRGLGVAAASPELSVLLGGILLDRGDRANAKVAFARALANAPQHTGALYGIGATLMDDGEFARAAERFRQALARDAAYVQARIGLGTCLLELGQRGEALAHLRAAAKAGPQFYSKALRAIVSSGHGQFWLKPSAAAEFLQAD
jgi:tetratricopeptide (TPR) repeat protein